MKTFARPVKMIAVFDETGAPTPLRFMIEEDGVWQVIKVDSVLSTESVRPAGMDALVFKCQSVIQEALRQYEIIYRIKPHQWELYKI